MAKDMAVLMRVTNATKGCSGPQGKCGGGGKTEVGGDDQCEKRLNGKEKEGKSHQERIIDRWEERKTNRNLG